MVKLPKFLKPYRDAGAFHSLLAPHRFIDEHVFLTKGGQLGIVLAAEGIDYECLTDATLESHAKRAANAWRTLSDEFRIYQYLLKQDRAPIEQRDDYASATVRKTVAARQEHLRDTGLYTIELIYVLLLEPVRRPGHKLSTRKVLGRITNDLKRSRDKLVRHAEAFERNIGDLLGVRLLHKQRAFAFLRLLVNLDPELAATERLTHDSHVDYFLPVTTLSCTDDGIRIGDAHLEVMSLREPPASTFPHVLRDFLKIEANFVLCSEFKRLPNEKAVAAIRDAQTHFHWSQWISDIPSVISMILNRGNRENVIADKSALNEVAELDATLARVNNDGEYLGEFSFTVVLYGWQGREALQKAATDAARIFGNHEGSLVRESYNSLNAYLAIIPGNSVFNLRRGWLLSGNYADLSFLYAQRAGDRTNRHLSAEHLVVLETSDRTPYFFNLHEGDELGALIFGAPGSGKSVTANLLIDHSQKHSPRTFILDLGGSYREITRKHGGTYMRMDSGALRINPFALPGTQENSQFLFTFVRLLLTNSGYQPSAHDDKELFRAIEGTYLLGAEHRTLGNLTAALPPHLKPHLHAWTGAGQYGSLFDNRDDLLELSPFQTFDFSGMEKYPQVLEPLLFYVFQRISAVVCDPALRTTYKQLWADEVWRFLANDTARQYLLSAGKTWRKHNGGIGLITQSLDDLRNAGILNLVNEVCPTKILLASPGADLTEYQRVFRLNEKELALYAGLIPKRQFLLKTDQRAKVLNVDLDKRALAEYSNDPFSNERRDAAIAAHGYDAGMAILAAQ
jgi:type IV secretion system protein TrbE